MKKYLSTSFDVVSFWILSVSLWLLPVLAISFSGLAFDVGKKFILVITVLVAGLCWLIGRLQENSFSLPKNWILPAGGLFGLSFLLSALFSGTIGPSLIGIGYEQLTAFSVFIYLLIAFLVGILFQSKNRVFNFYLGLFVSFVVVFLFQVVRLSWAALLESPFPLESFANGAINLIGKWNDLGIFFGLIAVLALSLKELLPAASNKVTNLFFNLILGASVIGLIFVNFYEVWLLLGVAALLVLVYAASFHDRVKGGEDGGGQKVRVFRPALVVFLIALVFIVLGRNGSWLSTKINSVNQSLGVSSFEVRPSWGGTSAILKQTIKSDPVFGVGPNKFVDQWVKYKPTGVNDTQFWNIDFNSGISFFPTVVVMTGILGAISLALFLLSIFGYGMRGLFNKGNDHTSRALSAVTFISLAYLLAMGFVYTSDTVVLAITFALVGLFVASLHENKSVANWNVSLVKDPKVNFVSILSFVAIILISVTGGYFVVQKFWSVVVFQKTLADFNASGNIDEAYISVERATKLSQEDLYYRALMELNLLQMGQLLNKSDVTEAQLVEGLKNLIGIAQSNADKAISLNESNYLNWTSKARLYEVLVPPPLAIPKAYEMASEFYQEALKRNPNNPAILFSLARLEASQNKRGEAKNYLNQAIAQKRNYTNALIALAQLEVEDGNIKEVIQKVEQGLILSPGDIGLWFEVGFLYYKDESYEKAAQAMAQAVAINKDYSNARYFLGLSLEKLGDKAGALEQFVEIEKLNPDNAEVKNIIRNLRAGNSALYQTPVVPPEDLEKAPINETN